MAICGRKYCIPLDLQSQTPISQPSTKVGDYLGIVGAIVSPFCFHLESQAGNSFFEDVVPFGSF